LSAPQVCSASSSLSSFLSLFNRKHPLLETYHPILMSIFTSWQKIYATFPGEGGDDNNCFRLYREKEFSIRD
jgi:hypothetical protein